MILHHCVLTFQGSIVPSPWGLRRHFDPWRWRHYVALKDQNLIIHCQSVIFKKIGIISYTTVKTSKFAKDKLIFTMRLMLLLCWYRQLVIKYENYCLVVLPVMWCYCTGKEHNGSYSSSSALDTGGSSFGLHSPDSLLPVGFRPSDHNIQVCTPSTEWMGRKKKIQAVVDYDRLIKVKPAQYETHHNSFCNLEFRLKTVSFIVFTVRTPNPTFSSACCNVNK